MIHKSEQMEAFQYAHRQASIGSVYAHTHTHSVPVPLRFLVKKIMSFVFFELFTSIQNERRAKNGHLNSLKAGSSRSKEASPRKIWVYLYLSLN